MPRILLLGSTDATLRVGEAALKVGLPIEAVVSVGASFSISYSETSVPNARFVDVPAWCRSNEIIAIEFDSYARILENIQGCEIPICLVAGWYHMIPRSFRERFEYGCLGFHASLLPKLRGGAPLNWAILTGLERTGVSMIQLQDGVDDGPIFDQRSFPIAPRASISDLVTASGEACAALVEEVLPNVLAGKVRPSAQEGRPSYCLQRRPDDGLISWLLPIDAIDRLVRAAGHPYPGAFSYLEGEKVFIWRTEFLENPPTVHGIPGQIVRLPEVEAPCVVTGNGVIAIVEATSDRGGSALEWLLKSNQKRFQLG